MSTINKEWLKQTIAEYEANRDELPFGLDTNSAIELQAFKLALASLEAEPVALRDERSGSGGISKKPGFNDLPHGTPLYAAQSAPVSVPNSRAITQYFDTIALEAAREIMCDVNRRQEFLGGEVQLLSRIQCRIDDACRAAMLQGADGNSPVIPDGWVACSERMPEKLVEVLVCTECGSRHVAALNQSMNWDYGDFFDDIQNVTHWMPMLAAPQQEVNNG